MDGNVNSKRWVLVSDPKFIRKFLNSYNLTHLKFCFYNLFIVEKCHDIE